MDIVLLCRHRCHRPVSGSSFSGRAEHARLCRSSKDPTGPRPRLYQASNPKPTAADSSCFTSRTRTDAWQDRLQPPGWYRTRDARPRTTVADSRVPHALPPALTSQASTDFGEGQRSKRSKRREATTHTISELYLVQRWPEPRIYAGFQATVAAVSAASATQLALLHKNRHIRLIIFRILWLHTPALLPAFSSRTLPSICLPTPCRPTSPRPLAPHAFLFLPSRPTHGRTSFCRMTPGKPLFVVRFPCLPC
ncbi:hypothetical protein PICMEDRAFT_14714 [Pichia membranifaciens NRRL Y-2026]|uniref:Uncharacterized protein n=1 Tax=Pichia membranifaciens NRRL Y-2026 TaxID=763406 RepID=A0A1E3NSX4_9ASCO|nr:hypothetical protein PICMEDRAFT_14714 [Pichia membranifaciens NRRL Y-2026]ODQ49245.1 hypothetical protein PICMEDRAFT_14714 [Pichia membranifaciens NRRL Y-2026]